GEPETKLTAGPPEVTGDVALDGEVAEDRDHKVEPRDVAPVCQVADDREDPGALLRGLEQRRAEREVVLADVERLEPSEDQESQRAGPRLVSARRGGTPQGG